MLGTKSTTIDKIRRKVANSPQARTTSLVVVWHRPFWRTMSLVCRTPQENTLQGMEMYRSLMGSMPRVLWSFSNDVGGRMLSVVGVSVNRIRRMKT